MLHQLECLEKGGSVLRSFRLADKTTAGILELVEKIQRAPNFFSDSGNPYLWLLDEKTMIYLIDDVGTVVIRPCRGYDGEAHVTFWDRRMRGREALCRQIGQDFLLQRGLSICSLFTAVPVDRRAVIAFSKRVGFQTVAVANGVEAMEYTFMLNPRWV